MVSVKAQRYERRIDRHVGAQLKAIRRHQGRTREWLAIRTAIPEEQIRKYETGQSPIPVGRLCLLAQTLGTDDIAVFYAGIAETCAPSPSFDSRPSPIKGKGDIKEHH